MNPTETLLSINEAIANTSDSEQLFLRLYHHLNQLYPFELSGIFLFDASREKCSIYWIGKQGAKPNLQCRVIKVGIQDLQDEPFSFQFNNPNIRIIKPQTLNFPIEMRNIKILFEQHAITETIHIPMMHRGILIGYIVLGFQSSQNMTANDAHFLIQIGNLIAAAVLNTRHFEEMERRNKITQFQVEFTNNMLRVINDPDIFLHLAKELNNRLNFDFFNIMVLSEHLEANIEATFVKTSNGSFRFVDLPDGFKIQPLHSQKLLIDGNPHITRLNRKELLEFVDSDTTLDEKIDIKILSMIYVVLKSESSCKIILDLGSTHEDAFTEEETDLLEHILPQLKLLLENYFSFEQSRQLKMHLENERNSLLKDWRHELNVDGFVAESRQMMQVLFRVKQVAPTDTTVLIEGETGVGKELIAKAIHFNSPRSSGPVVMVNCTTLPPNLIESELFGYEKGSFTGATERRIGKFELANGGTLFLDEIGELPIDLQSKLLRVIQEKEIERIGGKQTIPVNVRIVAATNRNLEEETKAGRFRNDLYFRLNVFPLVIPPLRERPDDIPVLVRHFIEIYGRQLGKPNLRISEMDLQKLMSYQWPGNVRELEHTIQRAVIISTTNFLDLSDFQPSPSLMHVDELKRNIKTLKEVEAEHIVHALRLTNGKVSGENGAAKLLGLNPKTLDSKMRKLGIKRELNIKLS